MNRKEKILWGIHCTISRLPFCVLYLLSDLIYPIVYYVIGYRKKVVRKNLSNSFPEKTEQELRTIEKKYYHFFCDYIVETLKMFTISEQEIMKRMKFIGWENLEKDWEEHGACFLMIGHYGNWEWFSSLPCWTKNKELIIGTVYQPLNNKTYDSIFLRVRNRLGVDSIASKNVLRKIVTLKREDKKPGIGFIADQSPHSKGSQTWVNFLNQDTAFYTGAEAMGKKINAVFYFAEVSRIKRGHYECRVLPMKPEENNENSITELYAQMLEQMIQRDPAYWLWSHKRWKRTRPANGNEQ